MQNPLKHSDDVYLTTTDIHDYSSTKVCTVPLPNSLWANKLRANLPLVSEQHIGILLKDFRNQDISYKKKTKGGL